MKRCIFFICLLFTLASCQKPQEVLTSSERMSQVLQQLVREKNIRTASVIILPSGGTYFNGDNEISFREGGFIGIGNSYWNLDKLIRYETFISNNTTVLRLTFSS